MTTASVPKSQIVNTIGEAGASKSTAQADLNHMAAPSSSVDPALLAWAEYWYPIAWKGLIGAGLVTALGAVATIAFLLLQWRTTSIKEIQSEWRTSALELQTEAARKETARLSRDSERLKKETAEANLKAEQERLARVKIEETLIRPRWLTGEQQVALKAAVEKFPGVVAEIWVFPVGAPDADGFGTLLSLVMKNAGWSVSRWLMQVGHPSQGGVAITWRAGADSNEDAARTLLNVLKAAGISAVAPGAFDADDREIGPPPPSALMNGQKPATKPTIRIFVGSKLNTF